MDRAQAVESFQTLNRVRIERLSSLFPVKNQFFLELLPLLFHTNSEALPGYIGEETPSGIVDYQPANTAIDAAKKIDPAFQYKRRSLHQYPIQGLYLINENGILNFKSDTQLKLLLIYTYPLETELIDQLQQKLTAICQWAKSIGIELNDQLLSHDSPNNSLGTFSLDAFYHSGLVLAGCQPSWWHTSPDEDSTQSYSLADIRQSARHSVLDFGPLASIDSQAMFDITAKHLNTAMHKGLESSLMLIYSNHQLEQYPAIPWLSRILKQSIYQDVSDPLFLDPNTLKLQSISTAKTDKTALFLAQQSFYILCEEHLSKTVNQSHYPWRREFIEQQLDSWQWPAEISKNIDQRFQSQYRQCLEEFEQVREQLSLVMQSLFAFAKQQKLHIQTQRIELEKKSTGLFETLPDTIPCLPDQFLPIMPEDYLYLSRRNVDDGWHISNEVLDSPKQSGLYHHPSLINVLSWTITNHLLTSSTHLKVADQTYKVTISQILELVQQLLKSPLGKIASEAPYRIGMNDRQEIRQVVLFANFEHQPVSELSQQGLKLSSLQNDPLNYANNKQSLVTRIEGLVYSNQGQWHYFMHHGITSPLQILATLLRWQPKSPSVIQSDCWCPSEHYGKDISARLSKLIEEVITHYKSCGGEGEYLLSIANQLYKLQWQQGACDFIPLSRDKSLFQHLAQAKSSFIKTKVDQSLDSNSLLNSLLPLQVESKVSVFLYKQHQYTTVYILNEFGSLYRQHVTGLTEATLVAHFHWFFNSLNISSQIDATQFFRLGHQDSTAWQLKPIPLHSTSKKEGYLPVTIEMATADDSAACIIHCGPKVFKGSANDNGLFKQVRDLVLSLRKTNKHYPLYITQLSFKKSGSYTSHQYIIQKQRLEYLLNKM